MDLFEPGTDSRIHDFTGGVLPSGLVWTVPIPDESVLVSPNGRRLDVDVHDVAVVDMTAGGNVLGVVSFQITWKGKGKARNLGLGNTVPPTDRASFLGRFFKAQARGTFSGSAGGFTFQSGPKRKSKTLFAELGTEQNGALITGTVRCDRCARPAPEPPLPDPSDQPVQPRRGQPQPLDAPPPTPAGKPHPQASPEPH